jgi:hypothetical protein
LPSLYSHPDKPGIDERLDEKIRQTDYSIQEKTCMLVSGRLAEASLFTKCTDTGYLCVKRWTPVIPSILEKFTHGLAKVRAKLCFYVSVIFLSPQQNT